MPPEIRDAYRTSESNLRASRLRPKSSVTRFARIAASSPECIAREVKPFRLINAQKGPLGVQPEFSNVRVRAS